MCVCVCVCVCVRVCACEYITWTATGISSMGLIKCACASESSLLRHSSTFRLHVCVCVWRRGTSASQRERGGWYTTHNTASTIALPAITHVSCNAHFVSYNAHFVSCNAHFVSYNAHFVSYNAHFVSYNAHFILYRTFRIL